MTSTIAPLTHLDERGQAQMVDVGSKASTHRIAIAAGSIQMAAATMQAIASGQMPKGDVLAVARVAGIMAAKRTHELIPLCHPIALTKVRVEFEIDHPSQHIRCTAQTENIGQTGVEMEALTACSVALLTLYDMAKAIDRGMVITQVRLQHKSGGKSGDYNQQ